MSNDPEHKKPEQLSVPEKILRVQDLWAEIAHSPQGAELIPPQREEAERQLLKHQSDPGEYAPWDEIRRRLEGER